MRLIFDLETNGLLPEVTVIHSLCIRDADTGELLMSCADQPGFPSIAEGIALLNQADQIIGHNIVDYDKPVLRKLRTDWVERPCLDTLLCVRLMFADVAEEDYRRVNFPGKLIGSHSLKAWGYRLGVLKGTFGEQDDWSRWTPEMQRYCDQDTLVTFRLLQLIERQRWAPESIKLEHEFAEYIHLQQQNGFGFNEEAARELYAELCQIRNDLTAQLQASFPPIVELMKTPQYYLDPKTEDRYARKKDAKPSVAKRLVPGPPVEKLHPFEPGSRLQAAKRLIERGWVPEEFTEGGMPKVDDETLSRCDLPEAALLAKFYLVDKRLGQLADGKEGWMRVVKNGKIHGSVITNGAVTGRCTHRGPNVAQTPRVITQKVTDPETGKEREEILWGEAGGWASDMRALWGPTRPGWVQVGADASGLELRCMAHYLASYDGGRYGKIVVDGDVHCENRDIFGLPADKSGRNKAKTGIYCLIYGGGDEKLGWSLESLLPEFEREARAMTIPKWAAKSMAKHGPVTLERARNWRRGRFARERMDKGLVGYLDLVKAVQEVAKTRGWLRGLDSRRLRIRKQHAALNTLLQSAGALLVKQATVIMWRKLEAMGLRMFEDWAPLGHIHDEVQIEARTDEIARIVGQTFVESLVEAGRMFQFKCRLDGEYVVGINWAATH
jgi:hypothetical protein